MEESWLVGKLRLLPKSGDLTDDTVTDHLSNPNNWRGITLLAARDCEVRLLGPLKSHDISHASDWARSTVWIHAGQEYY